MNATLSPSPEDRQTKFPPNISRLASFSKAISTEIIQPGDLNSMGYLFGGRLVSLIDKVAAISAIKHCSGPVVTLSIDSLVFKKPVPIGAIVTLLASVNRAFNHSLEVGVLASSLRMGCLEEEIVCSAYLTFVALDKGGQPIVVPELVPESQEDKRRYEQALIRRQTRLQLKESLGKSHP